MVKSGVQISGQPNWCHSTSVPRLYSISVFPLVMLVMRDACCLALAPQNARTVLKHLCVRWVKAHPAFLTAKALEGKEDPVVLSSLRKNKSAWYSEWIVFVCCKTTKKKKQTPHTRKSYDSSHRTLS